MDVLVYSRNPNYSGDRNWEDHALRSVQAESSQDPISINKLGMVAHTCNLRKQR
jgi:hypothetical protein